jgi:hypothetical protein
VILGVDVSDTLAAVSQFEAAYLKAAQAGKLNSLAAETIEIKAFDKAKAAKAEALAAQKAAGPGRIIEDLRVSFKVERDVKPPPNPASINLYNLSADTRAALHDKYFKVTLQAGYEDAVSTIFTGDVRTFSHEKDGTEWVTKIQAGDGAGAFQFARVANSFRPGVRILDVIMATVKALGIDPGTTQATLAPHVTGQYSAGYSQHAAASTELTRLLKAHGFEWSIQDGRLEVLKPTAALPGTVPVIESGSGLVGTPELGSPAEKTKPQTLKVKALLMPELRPGQLFQLNSIAHRGAYKCRKVTHSGDTHGGDWQTEIEAVKFSGGTL